MHSDEMEDISEVGCGEICALFGIECNSDTTFTDGTNRLSLLSMYVPEPVISLAIWPKVCRTTSFNCWKRTEQLDLQQTKGQDKHLSKALNRFQREDPTFRVHTGE